MARTDREHEGEHAWTGGGHWQDDPPPEPPPDPPRPSEGDRKDAPRKDDKPPPKPPGGGGGAGSGGGGSGGGGRTGGGGSGGGGGGGGGGRGGGSGGGRGGSGGGGSSRGAGSPFGADEPPGRRSGLVCGRFLPPHLGHRYLIDVASRTAGHLTVLLFSSEHDPIPGALRVEWVRAMAPGASVIHAADEDRPAPGDPDFLRRWTEIIRRHVPEGPAYFFASDRHGARFAEHLGAQYIAVDPSRHTTPIAGSAILADPMNLFPWMAPGARAHAVRRVCLAGAESTGKSTLARMLAEHYQTIWVPEHARIVAADRGGTLAAADIQQVARGQLAAEDAAAPQAHRLLLCDTDLLAVQLWSERLFGACPAWIRTEATARAYDLTLLLADDVPFVGPATSDLPAERRAHAERWRTELTDRARPHVVLSGEWDSRFAAACRAIDALLEDKRFFSARYR